MRKLLILCSCILLVSLCLTACQEPAAYTPTGEFYIKTNPSHGDTGVDYVISLEAEHKTYKNDGDIRIPMEVGLGHLPDAVGYDYENTFYVRYQIIEAPWEANKAPAWERIVEYAESWYDAKFNSTVQKNRPVLIAPNYGEFYPLYKENVDLLFPENVEKGYVEITVYVVAEGWEDQSVAHLRFYFERSDGVLTLNPYE